MSGAIPPLPQYAFMARFLVKAQGQLTIRPVTYLNKMVLTLSSFGLINAIVSNALVLSYNFFFVIGGIFLK